MANNTRNFRVNIPMTAQEYRAVVTKSDSTGLPVATWARIELCRAAGLVDTPRDHRRGRRSQRARLVEADIVA